MLIRRDAAGYYHPVTGTLIASNYVIDVGAPHDCRQTIEVVGQVGLPQVQLEHFVAALASQIERLAEVNGPALQLPKLHGLGNVGVCKILHGAGKADT